MGDAAGVGKCELKLGDLYLQPNPGQHLRVTDARAACQRALAQSNDVYHTALCNQLLSSIYIHEARLDDARSLLDTALRVLQKSGDRAAVATCLKSLAFLHIRSKRQDDAFAALRQAIAELIWLGRDLDAAFMRQYLGDMCDDEEAIELYQEAIPQFHASRFVFADAKCR
jgi:tetratricopeptide (TPR) repeat protein